MAGWRAFWARILSPPTALLAAVVRMISKFGLCVSPSGFRVFQIDKCSETYGLAVSADASNPSLGACVPLDAVNTGYVALLQPQVSVARRVINLSQIGYPVVVPITVDVVDDCGPIAMRNRPSHSVGREWPPSKGSEQVSVFSARRERAFIGASRIPLSAAHLSALSGSWREIGCRPRAPDQTPSFWLIVKAIAKVCNVRQGMLSHVVSPHVRGQGRSLLTQRFRPVFLNATAKYPQGDAR